MDSIYLDHNATTPLDLEVFETMRPYFLKAGNAESRHSAGRQARRAWEEAKETVARILGAEPGEVIFTSGGTEANNLAVFGLAGSYLSPGHLVSSPIEHPAVAEAVARLEVEKFRVDRPPVNSEGVASAELMADAFTEQTRLATLMLANNETGAIQPVQQLAGLALVQGIPVHTDAVQAVGRISVNFHALGVTSLAASITSFTGRWVLASCWFARGSGSGHGWLAAASSRVGGRGQSRFPWPWAWPQPWSGGTQTPKRGRHAGWRCGTGLKPAWLPHLEPIG